MSCGLLPLCFDAMALGDVPFCDVEGDQQQLTSAIGSSSKVAPLIVLWCWLACANNIRFF